MQRGTFLFDVVSTGSLANNADNVEALRRLWLDRTLVQGYYLGPGDPGDFDYGAWHVGCHLVGAGGVMRTTAGELAWLEVSHDAKLDLYYASATIKTQHGATTFRLDAAEGREALKGAVVLGFVEGHSTGRISAKGVIDPPSRFNKWRRQDFDNPVESSGDGGKVWEHWCTLRDIRSSSEIGTSVLTAYVSLIAVLGDLFAPIVARGRREYGHSDQLHAMVESGFAAKTSAILKLSPKCIPAEAEHLFLHAEPAKALEAVARLDWNECPSYYMFGRKIASWSSSEMVTTDLSDI